MQHRLISKLYFLWSKVLHSIPILLNKKSKRRTRKLTTKTYLRYVSYSIPLMCSLALLLLFCNLFIISDIDKTYAEGNITEVSDDDSNGNAGISTYATTTVNPTASLTIGGDATNKQVIASPGSTAYRSHTVTVDASDIESYALVLSGPTNLTSGTSTIVSGANNTTPATNASNPMLDNTWGYSWGGDSKKETSTYKSLSPTGTTLTGDRVSGFKVNFTRNLFFAAKFSEDADPGRYQANVTLSLAATPRAVATGFNGIYDMQDMAGEICAKANIGDAGSLEDVRDGNVYTVRKYRDGECWMTQNLRLVGGRTLTSADSNVSDEYVFPATKIVLSPNDFSNSGSVYLPESYLSAAEPVKYGVYYSWTAATAGTGNDTIIISGQRAPSSVCPKGWKLPDGAVNDGQYTHFINAEGITRDYGGAVVLAGAPYNFTTSGIVVNGGFYLYGKAGSYWTNAAVSERYAFDFFFDIDPTYEEQPVAPDATLAVRSDGRTVRCVAEMPKYTLTFDKNMPDYNVADMPSVMSCVPGSGSCVVSIPSNVPKNSCSYYEFLGWSTSKSDTVGYGVSVPVKYGPGDDVTLRGDQTLYAVWRATSGGANTCGS